jgi:catechol 2,3-dioxygenase-like lactoylglutathione lyase family enzyme
MNPRVARAISGLESVPCLLVDDLASAADYYREVLGFTSAEILGDPPAAVLARAPGGSALLQLASPGARGYARRRFGPRAWDAVFYVRDADRAAAALRARGALVQVGIGVTHVSEFTFEVRDPWGNILAFAATSGGLRSAMSRGVGRALPPPVRAGLRNWRLGRAERPHLREFGEFYAQLTDHRDIFYMFFAEGLLHWVVNAVRHIPEDVNLVLVGSALTPDEQQFIRANLNRPFHNIRLGVDDNTTWEFLFETNRHNFGYIDIDCFVLEPKVFADMTHIEDTTAVNVIWAYDATPELAVGCCHFVFVNAAVIEAMRSRGLYVSPTNYEWGGSRMPYMHNRTYCRIPTSRQRRQLLSVLPPDDHGRPVPPGGSPFFDTLVAYQVAAAAAGYPIHRVRQLEHRTQATLGEYGSQREWQQDMSDELVHIGGVSYYWKLFHMPEFRKLYLAAEYTLLANCAGRLPPYYAERLGVLESELGHLGISPAQAASLVGHHLTSERGLSGPVVDRLLGRAPEPAAGPSRQ